MFAGGLFSAVCNLGARSGDFHSQKQTILILNPQRPAFGCNREPGVGFLGGANSQKLAASERLLRR